MRKKNRLLKADELAKAVNAYRREHDHPMRDNGLLTLHYINMIKILGEYNDR